METIDNMTEEQFNAIIERLDDVISALKKIGKASSTSNTSKTSNNAPKSEPESLTGKITYVQEKEGAKVNFMIFTLLGSEKGDIDCKCFKSEIFDRIKENSKVAVVGRFQEWKGRSSFIVENVADLVNLNDDNAESKTEKEDDDDVPF